MIICQDPDTHDCSSMRPNLAPAAFAASSADIAHADYDAAVASIEAVLQALKAQAGGPPAAGDAEKQALLAAHLPALHAFNDAWAAFTRAGQALHPDALAALRASVQARLHPLILDSPFARRCFEKPLGYAGDYVMVRHILGDPFQGDSAFAQLVNFALVQADVAQGHRNRIRILEALLGKVAQGAAAAGQIATGLTIGCGPAEETWRFIRNDPHAGSLALDLLDFNAETLDWTASRLADACREADRLGRGAPALRYLHESVYDLAKKKPATVVPGYDLVICAGLFDYLTDAFCRRVIEFGARSLLPGGTLLVTNVSRSDASFGLSEVLEWDLIYRSAEQLENLLPRWEGFTASVRVDETGTNVVAQLVRE
jgi:extracellular factor (EF) 3-hydroxypalmitic acid methyl ester biosynthesis protein